MCCVDVNDKEANKTRGQLKVLARNMGLEMVHSRVKVATVVNRGMLQIRDKKTRKVVAGRKFDLNLRSARDFLNSYAHARQHSAAAAVA